MQKPRVLITGASRGIGLAISKKLAERYSLILHATTDDRLPALADDQFALCADFSDPEALTTFCTRLKKEHGEHLYAVINNAGLTLDKSLIFQPERDIDRLLQVNLKAPILISKTALKLFMLRKKGVILNMSSIVAETGSAFQSVYAATKAGLNAFSKSLAREAAALDAEHEVRVLCIAPGYIETDMTNALPEAEKERFKKMIPSKRFGTPEDVANMVAFLLSDEAAFVNATTVHVNGGML